MTRLGCRSYLRLLTQRRAGLSDAERFRLESHLQECEECAGDARDLDALVALSESEALPTLSASRRERALRSALAPRPAKAKASLETPWLRRLAVPVAIASAAAAGIALSIRGGGDDAGGDAGEDRSAQVDEPGGADVADVSTPAPDETPAPAPSAPQLADNEHIIAPGKAVDLGRASVTAIREAELVWRAEDQRVDLARGAIRVQVDPDPTRTFTVSTGAFSVVVLGTEFEVEESRVRVIDGAVRVIARDGTVLAEVTSGETWVFGEREAPETAAAAEPEKQIVPAARSLAQARRHIAAGEERAARNALVRALAGNPSRREMAEAHTLLAELAVVRGDRGEAARRYEQVANRFRGLVAAENALFAAARLRLQADENEAAEALLQRYLRQYPNGRFRAEVERNLDRLAD